MNTSVMSALVFVTACSPTLHGTDPATLRTGGYDHATLLVVTDDHAFELEDSRVADGKLSGTATSSWALNPAASSEIHDGDSIEALEREHGWRTTGLARPRFASAAWPALVLDLAEVKQVDFSVRSRTATHILGVVGAIAIAAVVVYAAGALIDDLGRIDAPGVR